MIRYLAILMGGALLASAAPLPQQNAAQNATPPSNLQNAAQNPPPAPAAPGPAQSSVPVITTPDPKKAAEAYVLGTQAEINEDWQSAFEDYSRAVRLAPEDREYFQRRELMRSVLVRQYRFRAERDAISDRLDQARGELRAALELDPGDSTARERLEELQRMGPQNPEDRLQAAGDLALHPSPGRRTLHWRGDVQVAYRDLASQFGLHSQFDPDLRPRSVRLDLPDVTFAEASRALAAATQTFISSLGPSLFYVAQDTPENRRNFDAQAVRTIPLPISFSPTELAETERVVRDISGIPRIALDTSARNITVRSSPQGVELAAQLVDSLEQPPGELLLDFEVLEVDRNAARQLGIIPPQTATIYSINKQEIALAQESTTGLVTVLQEIFGQPSSLSGLGTSQLGALVGAGQLAVSALIPPVLAFGGGGSTFLWTMAGATANFSNALSLIKSGQRVLMRAQDGQKATFFVGERYPVTLGTSAASFGNEQAVAGVTSSSFPVANYAVGTTPTAVAIADLNNDGFQDLVVANNADNNVSVLLGVGDGTFGTATTFNVGKAPVAITSADFNADGFADVAVVNFTDNTVSILLGKGDGTFLPQTTIPTGKTPTAIATGDFNADGHPDLVVTNSLDNTISVYLGNGDGTFQTAVTYPTGVKPVSVAVGDMNGDTFPDLVVVNQTENTIGVYFNNGQGVFGLRTPYTTGNLPTAVALADFNLDGFLDVAVANQTDNTVSIFLNTGTNGNLGPQATYLTGTAPVAITVADFNIDGLPDVAVTDMTDNNVALLINIGNGALAQPLLIDVGTTPVALASADFKTDSSPDLAVVNEGSNTVSIILNTTTLTNPSNAIAQTPFPNSEYQDLGLKIIATPRMVSNDEVALKLQLEFKSLTGSSINSIPVLTNRSVEQDVRLKEGETSMIVSLLDDTEMKSINGWPGLGELPLTTYLFASHNDTAQNTELLVVVTPRVVHFAPRKNRLIYAGTAPKQGGGPVAPPFARPGRPTF
jgi:type II secretory pathway component GspD/PulD (secretin)